ncbi:MAG TPA: DciA family protein [Candidatus Saccharimonadales bacterium]|nr:DciA family protein [Candidatus Saccharimonadales bacterium]
MNHIKSFLPKFMQTIHHEKQWKLQIISQWDSIMGSLSSKVSICKIYNNSITLGVTDSCWMQELNLLSELIKDKINKTLDTPRIELIRFKYISQHATGSQKKEAQAPIVYTEKKLTRQEQQALDNIKDPELSQALQGFLQTCHKFS